MTIFFFEVQNLQKRIPIMSSNLLEAVVVVSHWEADFPYISIYIHYFLHLAPDLGFSHHPL
jgi:hypothetical protein